MFLVGALKFLTKEVPEQAVISLPFVRRSKLFVRMAISLCLRGDLALEGTHIQRGAPLGSMLRNRSIFLNQYCASGCKDFFATISAKSRHCAYGSA